MPAKTPGPDAYDRWFRAKVQEATDDPRPGTSKARAMELAQTALDVADMPEDLGNLLDRGIEKHFDDRLAGPNATSQS